MIDVGNDISGPEHARCVKCDLRPRHRGGARLRARASRCEADDEVDALYADTGGES